ncbi:hypothetical protein HAZT_HAZT010222 [Hyalella azteca]|uniref:C2H2-type domain-containing protein n=1 Tax=Hyalella azteca TaxID=294128 RepID=A0A6A0H8Q4_HYAAZ|nr:hypothetical protein HAZT_HAZT010222 [Hyalella azteca]
MPRRPSYTGDAGPAPRTGQSLILGDDEPAGGEDLYPQQANSYTKSGQSYDPDYRPSGMRSSSSKRSCSRRGGRPGRVYKKRNLGARGRSVPLGRPLYTLENWDLINAKVRQSLRVPKFKVDRDFVTWVDSDPVLLLQRKKHGSAGQEAEVSAVERFTRTLELIARNERALLDAAQSVPPQLQLMPAAPFQDTPFVPALKDSEIEEISSPDTALPCDNDTAKHSYKYPIYTPPRVLASPPEESPWVLPCVSVSLIALKVSALGDAVYPQLDRAITEAAASTRPQDSYSWDLERNVMENDKDDIDQPGKLAKKYISAKKRTSKAGKTCAELTLSEARSETPGVQSRKTSLVVTPPRRSSRTPKLKLEKDFITWSEPSEGDGHIIVSGARHGAASSSVTSPVVASEDNGTSSYGMAGQDTRLTLRRTGSEYQVVVPTSPLTSPEERRRRFTSARRRCPFVGSEVHTHGGSERIGFARKGLKRKLNLSANTNDRPEMKISCLNSSKRRHTLHTTKASTNEQPQQSIRLVNSECGTTDGSEVRGPCSGSEVRGTSSGSEVRGISTGSEVRGTSTGSEVRGTSSGSEVRTTSGSEVRGTTASSEVHSGGADVGTSILGGVEDDENMDESCTQLLVDEEKSTGRGNVRCHSGADDRDVRVVQDGADSNDMPCDSLTLGESNKKHNLDHINTSEVEDLEPHSPTNNNRDGDDSSDVMNDSLFGGTRCYVYHGDSLVPVDASEAFIEPLDDFCSRKHRSLLSLDCFSRVIPTSDVTERILTPRRLITEDKQDVALKIPKVESGTLLKQASNDESGSNIDNVDDAGIELEATSENISTKSRYQTRASLGGLKQAKNYPGSENGVSLEPCEVQQSISTDFPTTPKVPTLLEKSEPFVTPETVTPSGKTEKKPRSKVIRPTLFCDECPYRSRAMSLFALHKADHALKAGRDPCPKDAPLSELVFDGIAVSAHGIDLARLLRCPMCTYATIYKASFTLHRKHHEKISGKPSYPCPFCIRFFFMKTELASHIEKDHEDKAATYARNNASQSAVAAPNPQPPAESACMTGTSVVKEATNIQQEFNDKNDSVAVNESLGLEAPHDISSCHINEADESSHVLKDILDRPIDIEVTKTRPKAPMVTLSAATSSALRAGQHEELFPSAARTAEILCPVPKSEIGEKSFASDNAEDEDPSSRTSEFSDTPSSKLMYSSPCKISIASPTTDRSPKSISIVAAEDQTNESKTIVAFSAEFCSPCGTEDASFDENLIKTESQSPCPSASSAPTSQFSANFGTSAVRRKLKSMMAVRAGRILKSSTRYRRSKASVADTIEFVLSRVRSELGGSNRRLLNKRKKIKGSARNVYKNIPRFERSENKIVKGKTTMSEPDVEDEEAADDEHDSLAQKEEVVSPSNKFNEATYRAVALSRSYRLAQSPRSSQSEKFSCKHCDFHTDLSVVFSNHMKKHELKSQKLVRGKHPCPHCSFRSANRNYLKRHISRHTGVDLFECPHCSYKTALKKSYLEHVRNHRGQRHTCETCGYSTAYETSYKRHLLTHDKSNLLRCRYNGCNFSTFRGDVLKAHNSTHVPDKKFKCHECAYQTSTKFMLKVHIANHTGEGLLQCPYCAFSTAKRYNLNNHIRYHTGKGRLDCGEPGCTYFTFRSVYLRRHRLHQHGIVAPEPELKTGEEQVDSEGRKRLEVEEIKVE